MRVLLVLCLAIALLRAGPAQAHAVLVDSTPAIAARLASGQIALTLRFNSRVDRKRSLLTLIRADRSTEVVPITPDGTDDVLNARLVLPPGRYTLRWQVLAVDGHITRGDVPFSVDGP
jgi:methionine-rich copper-binding protein CopC